MDGFQFNKYAGAALATVLGIVALNQFAGPGLVGSNYPHEPAYKLPVMEDAAASGGGEAAQAVDLGTLLAAASAEQGAVVATKCKSCHTLEKGGPNQTGPNLWGIVNRPEGSHAGFTYSPAVKAAGNEPWTYERLDGFLKNPRGYLPGTAMSFAGLKKPEERANILAYLRTLTDGAPAPYPAPVASAAPEAAAAAPTGAAAPAATEAAPAAPAAATAG